MNTVFKAWKGGKYGTFTQDVDMKEGESMCVCAGGGGGATRGERYVVGGGA